MTITAETRYPLVAASCAPPPSVATIEVHCSALQRFLIRSPPSFPEAELDPHQTRVGWSKLDDGAVEAVVQVTVVRIGGESADFSNQSHRTRVANMDLGPWLREQDAAVRTFVKTASVTQLSPAQTLPTQLKTYSFACDTSGMPLSDDAANTHCAVLQRFALQQPPSCIGAQIDPSGTKIGWRRPQPGALELVVQLRILALDPAAITAATPSDTPQWVPADFDRAEHRELSDKLDISDWLRFQDARARRWISAATHERSTTP